MVSYSKSLNDDVFKNYCIWKSTGYDFNSVWCSKIRIFIDFPYVCACDRFMQADCCLLMVIEDEHLQTHSLSEQSNIHTSIYR